MAIGRSHGPAPARVLALAAAILAALPVAVAAQLLGEIAQLTVPDGDNEDQLGASIALDGDVVVVGAPHDDGGAGIDQGSAYVFVRSGGAWVQQQQLLPADPEALDYFGASVSMDGETVVVGAPGDNGPGAGDLGSVYVFVRTGDAWTQQQKLTASDAAAGDQFGGAVSIDGDTVIAGAALDDGPAGPSQGAAYVFVRDGDAWAQQQKLTAFDAGAADQFGVSVAIDGDTLVVGAPRDNGPAGLDQGSAHVFVRDQRVWAPEQQLTAADPIAGDLFGGSVAVSGDTAVVGAAAGELTGAAYVFVREGGDWTQQQQLSGSGAVVDDGFGVSVAIDGETIVVGAPEEDGPSGAAQGFAYVYLRSGSSWTPHQALVASASCDGNLFGQSLSIDGNRVASGAPAPGEFAGGAAYVFAPACPGDLDGDGQGGVVDMLELLAAWGPCPPAQAQVLQQSAAIADPNTGTYDEFGTSMSIDADTLVVGDRGNGAGSAYYTGSATVFVRSGGAWSLEQQLTASDGNAYDQLGISVAADGDRLVAGALEDDVPGFVNAGSAYVFERSPGGVPPWTQMQKLTASVPVQIAEFGASVAIDGQTIIVGASQDDGPAVNSGSAYVFGFTGLTWVQQQKLTVPDAGQFDLFGASMSMDGDTVIVGAFRKDGPGGMEQGAAYVFVRNGNFWTQQQKLTASDATGDDYFGRSVAIKADTAVVGAHYKDGPAGINQGAAYVFVRKGTTWTQQQKLTASDAGAQDNFGGSVSLDGETIVVGASGHDGPTGLVEGAAYVFVRDGSAWTEQQKLTASGACAYYLGQSVSIGTDTVVAAAAGYVSDSLRVFTPEWPPCPGDIDGDGLVAIADLLQFLSAWGTCP